MLTREPDVTRPEYDIRDEHRDGLRVVVGQQHVPRDTRSFEDTYRNDAIGAIADAADGRVRPDVAHCTI